jgi:preprotein translocase subunit YajC
MFLQAQQQAPGWTFPAMLLAMFAIMYFLMIRPQQKRQKEHRDMLAALKKGDQVVTSGGIHGTVVGVKEGEGIVVLRIAESTTIELTIQNVAAKLK